MREAAQGRDEFEYEHVITSSYWDGARIYVGTRFAKQLGLSAGDEINLTVSEPGMHQEHATMTLTSNLTVGGPFVAEAFERLRLTQGSRYRISASPQPHKPVLITLSRGRSDSTVAQSTASELRLPRTADRPRRLRVFSMIDGPAGVNGGVATASSLLVEAFNQTVDDPEESSGASRPESDVEAWNVLLRKPSGYELGDHECYAFSSRFREILEDARQPDTLVWVIGHTRFSGEEAQLVQSEFNSSQHAPSAAATIMRRMHMVHMSPTQTAAARSKPGEGEKALRKLSRERELMSAADLVIFVGNSASDFLPDIENGLDERSLKSFVFPVLTKHEIDRASADEPLPHPINDPVYKILLSGRLDDGDVKGLNIARETVRILADHRLPVQPYQFVVVGADSQTEAQLLADMQPGERAMLSIFPNVPHPTVAQFIATSAIVVLPSSADALGLAAMEGLKRGRPTLVSDLSGISTFYRELGMERWVLPANRPDEWAQTIASICSTPETYKFACADAQRLLLGLNNTALERVAELRDAIYA
ncbi:glycosyltransferase family 4 protein [Microbacterium testaceum]|uniref:glycosyltransferase family 4 protein n=1 Tax=Microbacterium testaceum TaxID=2033 RepID=UPI0025AF3274|nr:glycosyltransferase family 4 protein [Microbacterium testaceum]WJS89646.1 glycosyltransferase family 4 protein [Microbacterium testaceum]